MIQRKDIESFSEQNLLIEGKIHSIVQNQSNFTELKHV